MTDDTNAGLIVTQNGVPVSGAADYQKTIDTRWTFLDIADEQAFDISHSDSGSTHFWAEKIMDHRLGYLPAFTFRPTVVDGGGSSFFATNYQVIATKNSVYIRNLYVSGDPTTPTRLAGFLRIFACDITTAYQAPIALVQSVAGLTNVGVGVKILTNGGSMNSTNLQDFGIDTEAKALAIQQTGTAVATTANSGTLLINHNLGYPPTYFLAQVQSAAEFAATTIFTNPVPEGTISPMDTAFGARITADAVNLTMKGVQAALSGTYAFLITKEPAEVAI